MWLHKIHVQVWKANNLEYITTKTKVLNISITSKNYWCSYVCVCVCFLHSAILRLKTWPFVVLSWRLNSEFCEHWGDSKASFCGIWPEATLQRKDHCELSTKTQGWCSGCMDMESNKEQCKTQTVSIKAIYSSTFFFGKCYFSLPLCLPLLWILSLEREVESCSVMSNSLWPHGLYSP